MTLRLCGRSKGGTSLTSPEGRPYNRAELSLSTMPTYDYACSGCKHRFERFEPIGAGGLKQCPKCGKKKAKRMIGMGAGLIFKGSGFYTTDSKGPAPKGGEGEAKKPEVKPETEKKPDVKKKEEKEPKK